MTCTNKNKRNDYTKLLQTYYEAIITLSQSYHKPVIQLLSKYCLKTKFINEKYAEPNSKQY